MEGRLGCIHKTATSLQISTWARCHPSIDLNQNIAREIGADSLFYNSPAVLAKGIGISENELWFPEWVRFIDYK